MALVVLGAGATRGASFVDANKDPCLPPLDGDFFTQLQRVRNPKHHPLISEVMADVVELFGQNFDATLETVFATLENTIRMLQVTGENRDYKSSQLKEKRTRLKQAIAVVLEDSLANKYQDGTSSLTPRECDHHATLVKDILRPNDTIISFNYDCVIDFALRAHGQEKWHPRYGYGLFLGSHGSKLTGDDFWKPEKPGTNSKTIYLYKLHGSLNFQFDDELDEKSGTTLKQRPYTKQQGNLQFSIIPPEWNKAYDKGPFTRLWKHAASAINQAEHIVMIGYSLPTTDLHATALFRTSVRKARLKSLVLVNPDSDARRRARSVLQRGFNASTKVLSLDTMSAFSALDRAVWD